MPTLRCWRGGVPGQDARPASVPMQRVREDVWCTHGALGRCTTRSAGWPLAPRLPEPAKRCGIVEADETFVLENRKGERRLDRKPRPRASVDPGRCRPGRRDPQPYPARPQCRQRERGAGTCSRPVRCSSPTPTTAIRPPLRCSISLMRASTLRLASGSGARCTFRPSTAATAKSRSSCVPATTPPPNSSTAIWGGSILPNSPTSLRPEPA